MRLFSSAAPEACHQSSLFPPLFEGWYLRFTQGQSPWNFALIAGFARDEIDTPIFFLQGIESDGEVFLLTCPKEKVTYQTDRFEIHCPWGFLSIHQVQLDISQDSSRIEMDIKLSDGSSTLAPRKNVMDWAQNLPFLPCYHYVHTMNASCLGKVSWGSHHIQKFEGRHYLERDWGSTFPKEWMWTQSHALSGDGDSITAVWSRIRWGSIKFTGAAAVLIVKGISYSFSTARFHRAQHKANRWIFRSKSHRLVIEVSPESFSPLLAPQHGKLLRPVEESLDSELKIELWEGTLQIYSGVALQAGYELEVRS